MADVAKEVVENITEAAQNGTSTKTPATIEGMLIAYGALFTMAIVSIYIGSVKSVKFHKNQKVRTRNSIMEISSCHYDILLCEAMEARATTGLRDTLLLCSRLW